MQAPNFGAHLTSFPFELFMRCSHENPLYFSHHTMMQKSQNDPKVKSMGGWGGGGGGDLD